MGGRDDNELLVFSVHGVDGSDSSDGGRRVRYIINHDADKGDEESEPSKMLPISTSRTLMHRTVATSHVMPTVATDPDARAIHGAAHVSALGQDTDDVALRNDAAVVHPRLLDDASDAVSPKSQAAVWGLKAARAR